MNGIGGTWLRRSGLPADLAGDDGEPPPRVDAEDGAAVVADVRLDNRDELCAALDVSATERQRLSDSRLIVRAWRKWGRDCPTHLVGDFAFAIWDEPQRTLFCARDHIGARPLFYHLTPERFVFASEMKRIVAVPGVSAQLDDEYVVERLSGQGLARTHRTYLAAVHRLPPGHTLTVRDEREERTRYWTPGSSPEIRFTADADYAEAARAIVVRAVADRLRTSRAVGVHLSGGLDSSAVAVLAARERRRLGHAPPVAFCWQPPPGDGTPLSLHEHTFVQTICDQEGLTPRYCPATMESIVAVLQTDGVIEPITQASVTEGVILEAAAAQGVRLILTGLGGDEGISFNARGYYANLLLRGRWRRLYHETETLRPRWRFIAREARRLIAPKRTATTSFVNPDVARRVKPPRRRRVRATGARSTLLWLWDQGFLTTHIESWGAHGATRGIRYAYPLLDRRLLEFVAGLPPEQFVRGDRTRWLMRRAMEGILPPDVLRHADKTDAIRGEQFLSASRRALSSIGRELETRPVPPARARYVDMPRLLRTLRPESIEQQRVGKLMAAVMFLDL